MNKDDLTQVKNIGNARKKILASHGITTVQQLYKMPLEKLMQIKSLGRHYAKLIKVAVNEYYETKAAASAESDAVVSTDKKEKSVKIDRKIGAELAKTPKYLKRAKRKFEPINKKKHLKLFVEFKTKSNGLKMQILTLRQSKLDLSKKQKKKILRKAEALNVMVKHVGKKKKAKTMNKLNNEIKSLLNLLGK